MDRIPAHIFLVDGVPRRPSFTIERGDLAGVGEIDHTGRAQGTIVHPIESGVEWQRGEAELTGSEPVHGGVPTGDRVGLHQPLLELRAVLLSGCRGRYKPAAARCEMDRRPLRSSKTHEEEQLDKILPHPGVGTRISTRATSGALCDRRLRDCCGPHHCEHGARSRRELETHRSVSLPIRTIARPVVQVLHNGSAELPPSLHRNLDGIPSGFRSRHHRRLPSRRQPFAPGG